MIGPAHAWREGPSNISCRIYKPSSREPLFSLFRCDNSIQCACPGNIVQDGLDRRETDRVANFGPGTRFGSQELDRRGV